MDYLEALIKAAVAVTGRKPKSRPLRLLLKAKSESDRRNYKAKHSILKQLMYEDPKAFHVDSESRGVVGLTHRSGFRIHAPRRVVPHPVLLRRHAASRGKHARR